MLLLVVLFVLDMEVAVAVELVVRLIREKIEELPVVAVVVEQDSLPEEVDNQVHKMPVKLTIHDEQ